MFKYNKFHKDEGIDDALFLGMVDTHANILASTPTAGKMAFATDISRLLIGNGTVWKEASSVLKTRTSTPDIGKNQDSSLDGYTDVDITDKILYNTSILGNANSTEGSVRTVNGKFQVYLNSVWNDIVMNLRLRESASEAYAFQHNPIGFAWWYEVNSGDSVELALNGLPFIQQYSADMGAFPYPLIIQGRNF